MRQTIGTLIAFSIAQLRLTLVVLTGLMAFVPINVSADSAARTTVVISDLHFGLGRIDDWKEPIAGKKPGDSEITSPLQNAENWHPYEDFRWNLALSGFLKEISKRYLDRVDLVIAGDMLELWQRTKKCIGCGEDLGCDLEELKQITDTVLLAHQPELNTLREFANKGDNRIHVIPGNHDAALLVDKIWEKLETQLGAMPGRLVKVASGSMIIEGGLVAIEHGHQIDPDVNRFKTWPNILLQPEPADTSCEKHDYMVRTWGESFVSTLFNDKEAVYPIVDNLVPESAGISAYSERRNFPGKIRDYAKFIGFVVFQNSLAQKVELGAIDAGERVRLEYRPQARDIGYLLFAYALREGDPSRKRLLEATGIEVDMQRTDLSNLLHDSAAISDTEVLLLCESAVRQSILPLPPILQPCVTTQQLARAKVADQKASLFSHLEKIVKKQPRLRYFIYGHTHLIDRQENISIPPRNQIDVLNTGAFQRVVDAATLKIIAAEEGIAEIDRLTVKLEKLRACYSAVFVERRAGKVIPQVSLRVWVKEENDKPGELLDDVCDKRCGVRPANLCKAG